MKSLSIVIVLYCLVVQGALGQKVNVSSEDQNINGVAYTGFATSLDNGKQDGNALFHQYLKKIGKTRKRNGYFITESPTLNEIAFLGLNICGEIDLSSTKTYVWIGYEKDAANNNTDLEHSLKQAVYEFGIHFYETGIYKEVDETERALQFTTRKQQKLLREEREYKARLADAEAKKIRLEKSLEATIQEIEDLSQKIIDNKSHQDTTLLDIQKIEKAVEITKAKLKGVN